MNKLLILISGGGLFVGLFTAALLLSPPRGGTRANRILSLLMAVYSLNIAHPLVSFAWPEVLPASPTTYLTEPMQFLLAPLIAAYFRALILPDFRLRPKFLVHVLPYLAAIAFSLSHAPTALEEAAGAPVVTVGLWALLVAQFLAYLLPSLSLLRSYRQALKDRVSNTSGIDLGWLMWFHNLILVFFACYTVILAFLIHGAESFRPRVILSVGLSGFVCVLGYRGLLQKATPEYGDADGAKYEKSALSPEEAQELRQRLERVMESERPYLDPELDLSALAERVGVARNRISYVINRTSGGNFYDYVNGFRVPEVLRLMNDPSRSRDKMISLAFDAGFNSKPTFNAVFKKLTGRTPSEHRRGEMKDV
jgi:AraC-like DNA-binding protein